MSKRAVSAVTGNVNRVSGFVDYRTNLVADWAMNRGLTINLNNTSIESILDMNGNFGLAPAGTATLTTNNEITLAVLGEGFSNLVSTEVTNGLGFTGDISICFYVKKPAAHSAIQVLFDSVNANSSGNPLFQFQTQISGANLNMRFSYNGVNYVLTGSSFPYDTDYHCLIIRARNDAGTIKLSLLMDGVLIDTEKSVTGSMTNWDEKQNRRFLRSSTTTWFGSIKRIRIYKEWITEANALNLSDANAVFRNDEVDPRIEKVFATWGQSNWLGEPYATTGDLPADRQIPLSRCNFFSSYTFRKITGFLLSEVRPLQGPGPIIEMGYQIKEKYQGQNFYFIQVATSGVSQATYFNSRTAGAGWVEFSNQLTNLLVKLKAEGRTISEVNIADYQGEADATVLADANNFETNRGNFYDDTITIATTYFPSATTKVAACRIHSGLSIISYPYRDTIRTALANLEGARAYMTVVSVDSQTIGVDGTHLLTAGLQFAGAGCAAWF